MPLSPELLTHARKEGKLTPRLIQQFRALILGYYKKNKRPFSWREPGLSPYHVLVSEIMLQQTQTARVNEKFPLFIAQFPTARALAEASLRDVLTAWQGMGYNRRALLLKKCAEIIEREHKGIVPDDEERLDALPGIGAATAASIAAYAYNKPTVFIETNIRTVYIHFFFHTSRKVSDAALVPLVKATLDSRNPNQWYNALMDYGVYLKSMHANPSRKSRHYSKQSPFKGSLREIRGAVLRLLTKEHEIPLLTIMKTIGCKENRVEKVLKDMKNEGFLVLKGTRVLLSHK